MFQVRSWPNVILHLDGDAFFASVMQAIKPSLKGKPIVVGKERGIATAISYEAKKFGIKRGMRAQEIKKLCPNCLFLESDYEAYGLFSQKMFSIFHSFSPWVEEYSVDEGFADLKGLRRPYQMTYPQIGQAIKERIESSLGISVSIGISLTKSLAKLASSFQKPSGLTIINGPAIEKFLGLIPLHKVWGIGENTTAYLEKLKLKTALDLALKSESFIKNHLTKPYLEIWHELRGVKVYKLNTSQKTTYKSISKSQTFRPPTSNPHLLWARILDNIEQAFQKARRFNFQAGKVILFLKTQSFAYHATEIKLIAKTSYPLLIRNDLEQGFKKIHQKEILYRATGCYLADLEDDRTTQTSLFTDRTWEEKTKKIYPLLDEGKVDFGTSLFDHQRMISKKKTAKTAIPFLSV